MDSIASPQRRARERAGLTVVDIAARVRCATNTVGRYELDRNAVREPKRRALDAVYEPLLVEADQQAAS